MKERVITLSPVWSELRSRGKKGHFDSRNFPFDDALRATRYALSEMNGFTPWFNDLIHAQPEAVRFVLSECISGEWEIPADSEQHHLVLSSLAWTESPAGDLIKPTLMERLADSEPKNPHVLRDVLCIVVRTPFPLPATLAALAERRSTAVPRICTKFSIVDGIMASGRCPCSDRRLRVTARLGSDPTLTMISDLREHQQSLRLSTAASCRILLG